MKSIEFQSNLFTCPAEFLRCDFFNSNLEVVSVDTIGGVMIDHFGRVPEKGETFQIDRLKISVLEADNRRIYRVTVDQTISNETNLTKSKEEFHG